MLLAPYDEITKMSIYEIDKCESSHYCLKSWTIANRFRSGKRVQGPKESIREYSLRLLKASEKCNFEEFKDNTLIGAFILGVNDPKDKIKEDLLEGRYYF
ncbi:hypothetical protein RF11_09110 [Thelohanellus kitauei]|uniref:Uncharacterized protein n=1 Tax=Thelohanellus kitauei TaxID=669202 RepID=A0A0C2J6G7_THEKT|nr:hypothetical protein RF11_09110 [Thelohanellus kitauei]